MTRFVLISDTHNTRPTLPQGEVLIHAGDLTGSGTRKETEAAMQWLGWQALKFKAIVFVGGNHDWFLYHLSKEAGVDAVRQFVRPYGENIHYLEDEFIGLPVGVVIYGSPVQPEFGNWAWNQNRGAEIRATWDKIPTGIDMLITHGPPYHVLDWVGKTRVGCVDLRDALDRVQPKVHVFGHIHAGHGKAQTFAQSGATTQCYNAAVCGEAIYEKWIATDGTEYQIGHVELDPKHHPWVLEWDGKKFTEVPGIYVI